MGPPPRTARPSLPPPTSSAGSRLASGSSTTARGGSGPAPARLSLAARAGAYANKPTAQRLASNTSQVSSTQGSEKAQELQEESMLEPSELEYNESSMLHSPNASRHAPVEQAPDSPMTARSVSSQVGARSSGANAASQRKIEDMETKIRMLEKKRLEDRERLKEIDHVKGERDKFKLVCDKLQAKIQPQVQEINELRKEVAEEKRRREEVEEQQVEHDHVLENATMDQLIAEETAEVLRYELEALKAKAEELELEVEVLREENNELGGEMSAEEKAGQGWIAMERNNERLREALLRLRDITQETEEDLKHQIKNLETDLNELTSIKELYEECRVKLSVSESQVEDLRQQLDNALGAEDMIEELTERNMSMAEEIEEMKAVIEDLEALKELNDELEINHVETEKEMQEDLDFKDTVINEQARRAQEMAEQTGDMEYTLSRFRELVTNLHGDLEDMRASHAVTETEAEKLNMSSRAMMDLNMKLQLSAQKTQVKTIELELRRLEAQEASDHLQIVQLFLPEGYATEKDSVLALLRFKRVGFKANLLHSFVKERILSVPQGHEDDIFAACDVLDKLAWVSAMCSRFASAISHCSTEAFAKFEGALWELEPVERALNAWIDGLRRDELKEKQCANDLQRTVALMTHLGEIHITARIENFGDEVLMRTLTMQSHLESTASALTAAKKMVDTAIPSTSSDDEEEAQHFTRKIESIINATRSAKVIVIKAVRSLEDLKSRSLSLPLDTLEQFETCESATKTLALFTRTVGLDLHTLLSEEGRQEVFTWNEIQETIARTTKTVFEVEESSPFSSFSSRLASLTTSLSSLADLAGDFEITTEFEPLPHPWIVRSRELTSSRTVPVDAEEEMRRLREDNHERLRTIALRDQALEEQGVRIELLESRTRDSHKKAEKISHLENKISGLKARVGELEGQLEAQERELAVVEGEKDKWQRLAGESRPIAEISPTSAAGKERAVATATEITALSSEITALQSAVRYLRESARRAKLSPMEVNNLSWLSEPLLPAKSAKVQRKELIVAEGKDVLGELLTLCGESRLFELSKEPSSRDRLKWRPVRSTAGWHVAAQRERWEEWRGWEEEVKSKAKVVVKDEKSRYSKSRRGLQTVVRMDLRLPTMEKLGVNGQDVQIVGSEEFEGFKGQWGFM